MASVEGTARLLEGRAIFQGQLVFACEFPFKEYFDPYKELHNNHVTVVHTRETKKLRRKRLNRHMFMNVCILSTVIDKLH